MIRFLLLLFSVICLAWAVIFGVLDLTRSIGASEPVLTPLSAGWDSVAPGTRQDLSDRLGSLHPVLSEPILSTFVSWPAFAVLGALALLLAALAQPRRRRKTRPR